MSKMPWSVAYGIGRILRVPWQAQQSDGWEIRTFPTEELALAFACERVKAGSVVQFVSEMAGDPNTQKYRHIDIIAMCADDQVLTAI